MVGAFPQACTWLLSAVRCGGFWLLSLGACSSLRQLFGFLAVSLFFGTQADGLLHQLFAQIYVVSFRVR